MPKKTTLRFYTASERYSGWKYLKDVTYLEIINWIQSYNYILIGDMRLDIETPLNNIFMILRRKN
jgi:hypothetical protein